MCSLIMFKLKIAAAMLVSAALLFALPVGNVIAQFSGRAPYNPIFPQTPTSSDHIVAKLNFFYNCPPVLSANPYSLKMEQNKITITFIPGSAQVTLTLNIIPQPQVGALIVDLGRLPPGNYTLTTIGSACAADPTRDFTINTDLVNYPFVVTDGRLQKPLKWVTQDISGHWWDPGNPGHGVFIHQDAMDNILGTWFTHDEAGVPIWYVFQPKWVDERSTNDAALWRANKPPSQTVPSNDKANLAVSGTVKLALTKVEFAFSTELKNDPQELIFTFGFGEKPTAVRTIRLVRFRP